MVFSFIGSLYSADVPEASSSPEVAPPVHLFQVYPKVEI